MSSRTERLAAAGYGAGWSLVKAMPAGLAERSFRVAADRAYARRGPSTVQLARNLHRVLGPDSTPEALAAVTLAGLRSYARYWRETFRLPSMDHEALATAVNANLTGMEYIERGMAAGRGVILALPHSANWDLAGLAMVQRFGGFTTVVERLKPESLFDRFVAYRESLGFEVLALTGGANPSGVLRQRLTAGGLICLVADRDLSRNGVPVDFFGEPTRMPAGPAMLAAITGADLLPAHLHYLDDGVAASIGPPVALAGTRLKEKVASGTQQLADFFAERIAEHPADWHMLQPLWLADLTDRPETPVLR